MGLKIVTSICAGLCLLVGWLLFGMVFGYQGNSADSLIVGGLVAVIFAVVVFYNGQRS